MDALRLLVAIVWLLFFCSGDLQRWIHKLETGHLKLKMYYVITIYSVVYCSALLALRKYVIVPDHLEIIDH